MGIVSSPKIKERVGSGRDLRNLYHINLDEPVATELPSLTLADTPTPIPIETPLAIPTLTPML